MYSYDILIKFFCSEVKCFSSVFLIQMIEYNHLFQKDRGKTASAARNLSPDPTRRPLPCLLNQYFFYGVEIHIIFWDSAWRCRLVILLLGTVL